MIGTLDRDGAITIQPMMNVHVTLGVMHVAEPAIGTVANNCAIRSNMFMGSCRKTCSRAKLPTTFNDCATVIVGNRWVILAKTG
jgi:hypothetical protein